MEKITWDPMLSICSSCAIIAKKRGKNMPIRSDRKDVLIFERRIEGIIFASHKINIEWQELIENGEKWVAFDYQYNHFKDPWIFNKEHVVNSIAKMFNISQSYIHSGTVYSRGPENSTIRVKIHLSFVQKEFLLEGQEYKPTTPSLLMAHSLMAARSITDLTDEELSEMIKKREGKRNHCIIF